MKKGWVLLRALVPPWGSLGDPLVSYDIHPHRRSGQRPWSALVITAFTLLLLCTYLVSMLDGFDPYAPTSLLEDLLPNALGIVIGGMSLFVMLGHWRLLLAVAGRGAGMIAVRKQRGDWDLIAITPVPKSRWFSAQLTILGWQVFPLVRQLLVVQGVMVLLGFSYTVYFQYLERQDCIQYGCAYTTYPLPIPLYALMVLPFAALIVLEPLLTLGVFSTMSLYVSTLNKRITMSVLGSFVGVYVVRVLMTLVLLISGILLVFLISSLFSLIGFGSGNIDVDDLFSSEMLFLIPYCCMWSIIGSFALEWFPALGALVFLIENDTSGYLGLYIASLGAFSLAYVLIPLLVMRILGRITIARLEARER